MSDATRVLDLLLQVNDLFARDMERALGAAGLTPARMHVLWVVRAGGPVSQQQLAEALRVTPRNVTGLVDALESGGFVTREPHPTDRRSILVTLTPRGETIMDETERDYQALASDLQSAVPPRDRAAFGRGLEATVQRLHALVEAGAQPADARGSAGARDPADSRGPADALDPAGTRQ
jgi:DNA-binding MarR family transcriptional regulator